MIDKGDKNIYGFGETWVLTLGAGQEEWNFKETYSGTLVGDGRRAI